MNNKIIILWGFISFGLVISIYVIGISRSEEVKYDEIKESLKLSVDNYLSDTEEWPKSSVTITSEDLIKEKYLNELFYEGSKCSAEVTVTNNDGKYNYEYNITCFYE